MHTIDYDKLIRLGIPVPLRMIAAAGGMTINKLLRARHPEVWQQTAGRAGTRSSVFKTWKDIGWFRIVDDQIWSPALTERTTQIGITIRGFRLAISRQKDIWTDERGGEKWSDL